MSDLDHADFRAAAAAWLTTNFPASLKGKGGPGYQGPPGPPDDVAAWTRAISLKGWATPTWPCEYGGGGLSEAQAEILDQEMSRAGAWPLPPNAGRLLLGPTILEYGTEDQKRQHVTAICRDDVQWCQGFSEPGSGSDLASLQTKAEDRGNHFLVNGQKIWTTLAHVADWCFCLVRTDSSQKQGGISFLLFDMKTPGIEARPIRLINGESEFCEMFLTDVEVPKENLLGPLNGGWGVTKFLLEGERSGITARSRDAAIGNALADLAKRYVGVDDKGRIADSDLRARIAAQAIESRVFTLTAQRMAAAANSVHGPGAMPSIMKNAEAQIFQQEAELTLEILGAQGIGWEGEGFTEAEIQTVRQWLYGKAVTIYGGSSEIQFNIIAKRVLGLPDAAMAVRAG